MNSVSLPYRFALLPALALLSLFIWGGNQPEAAGLIPPPWDKLAHLAWFAVLAGFLHVGLGMRRGLWVSSLLWNRCPVCRGITVQIGVEYTLCEHCESFGIALLVEAYEKAHCPITAPDPISFIEHVMDARGLTRKDLEPFIGPRGRVADILNRTRPLSMGMIRSLTAGLNLPADILIQPYPLREAAHV